jgi:hypothetical protein
VLAVIGLGTPAVMADTASAAVTPVIYGNYTSGWSHTDVKPKWVVIGQGGSPIAHVPRR